MEYVEVPDAEIAPGRGIRGVNRNGAFPHLDGFGIAPAVIQQVAEIVRRMSIATILLNCIAEQNEFFNAAGKDVRGIGVTSALADRSAFVRTTEPVEDVGLQVQQDGLCSGG